MPKQATKHTTQSKPKVAGRSTQAMVGARTGARTLVLDKVEASLVALLCAVLGEGAGRCHSRKEKIERFAGGGCRISAQPTGDVDGTWAVRISAADSVATQAAEFKIKELAKSEEGQRVAREARSASRLLTGAYDRKQAQRPQQQAKAKAPAAPRQEEFPALGATAKPAPAKPPVTQAAAAENKADQTPAASPQAVRVASFFASFGTEVGWFAAAIDTATATATDTATTTPAVPPPTLACPVALAKQPELRRVPSAGRWGDLETPRDWSDETPRTPQAA
jgi:hypothetical protein